MRNASICETVLSNQLLSDRVCLPARMRGLVWVFVACSAFLLSAAAAADGGAAGEHEYVGPAKCKSCHKKEAIGDQYGVWLDSKHAKAFETLAGEQAAEWAAAAGVTDPQADEKCVKCHVTAYGAPQNLLPASYSFTDSVSCEACHGAGKDYRKKKVMVDRELAESKGLIVPTEKVCLQCHNDESPAWKNDRYTLANGSKVGFDYEQALEVIAHPVPEGYDPSAEGGAD
jgi:hypothetical protein